MRASSDCLDTTMIAPRRSIRAERTACGHGPTRSAGCKPDKGIWVGSHEP